MNTPSVDMQKEIESHLVKDDDVPTPTKLVVPREFDVWERVE